ncbi:MULTISPECIES: methylmalonyl-CoA mutase family protein [Streptomyces]|uniref:methylmalonyl-CoA mutase n=1 Tax=Streptomyces stelliscabiei TaxID=146820 RepID=A0A8I0TWZ2_9ACTN|nr:MULTISPECIES: methylmalonyl-CoA mutase family protein [Streptomyces]KND40623.1 methylmalonyl-CoA mutase [Streptomyces stelliscabiei]MBE1600863.1 methylmalonyl-CoA mutase [Streptomyces stelliscabiei]MDX2519159.1 methylmalonyl-CoA mutase family protein [Streptomyces stelliscabiei]MDX2554287.1 methylmalonyl-CoA mutase family protein [Streptomyces stelliscabiei]MDX2609964.1 methylmalonyl-CoA mutase family protein [Streptomyces stelliscabiei]
MTVLPDDGLELAAEFPDATHEQWQRLVAGVLRKSGKDVGGAQAEEALSTALEDGLRTRPLYTAHDTAPPSGLPGFAPFVRGGRAAGNTVGGWDVRQRHTTADRDAVLADLENGVTSLWLVLGEAGLPVSSLGRVLDGVYLDLAPVVLDAGAETEPAADELLRLYAERGVAKEAARGTLGADPLGHEARTGQTYDFAPVAGLARLCAEEYPGLRALTVDALPYHEAGGSAAQELGASLATGVAYLRELTGAGLSVEQACAQLEFRYAATADQFLTIAKLRAARRLWARVAEVCGAPAAGAQIQHAVTSPVMMTRRDPWVNMLRTTIATLAAGAGGADSVTVLPFDHALGLPDAFARRIARNTSTILVEESHLARVIDPAGGSWYVERLTDELAHAGWEFFQEIERAGGQAAALRSGAVRERLAETWAARSAKLAQRREPVTGVSEFPHLAEKPVVRAPAPEPPSGGLPRVSRDEAFEALRARSDAHLAATGSRPRLYLASLGPAAAHTARATFAANLFQAGGIEPVTEGTFEESGATEVCLCSSDAVYEERAATAAAALRAAGASHVFLAGRPAEYTGVDGFVFAGCDAVAVLSATLDRMGVSR